MAHGQPFSFSSPRPTLPSQAQLAQWRHRGRNRRKPHTPPFPFSSPSLRPNARPVEARCLFLSSSRCQPGPACQPRRHLFPLAVSKVDSTGKITKPDFSGFLANSHDTEPYKALSPPRSLFFASESIKPNPNFVYRDLWFSPSYLPPPCIATPLRAFSDLENTLGELASSFSSLQ